MSRVRLISLLIMLFLLVPEPAYAMHIMEGFLPAGWAVLWFGLALPFWLWGLRSLQRVMRDSPNLKMLVAFAGAFAFVLSALKMPSVTGSTSHPTGVGLGAILFGPTAMTVLGSIVLLFQAILLAHGGLTTLGANTFSMAVVGPLAAFGAFRLARGIGAPPGVAVFLAAALADLTTYIVTSFQLALAFPDPTGGVAASLVKFLAIFAVTQVPLAIGEGLLTVLVYNLLGQHSKEELAQLELVQGEVRP